MGLSSSILSQHQHGYRTHRRLLFFTCQRFHSAIDIEQMSNSRLLFTIEEKTMTKAEGRHLTSATVASYCMLRAFTIFWPGS